MKWAGKMYLYRDKFELKAGWSGLGRWPVGIHIKHRSGEMRISMGFLNFNYSPELNSIKDIPFTKKDLSVRDATLPWELIRPLGQWLSDQLPSFVAAKLTGETTVYKVTEQDQNYKPQNNRKQ